MPTARRFRAARISAVVLMLFLLLYPLSMAVLGVTHSPLASINPAAWWRMLRLCGLDYLWIPAAVVPAWSLVILLSRQDLPAPLFDAAANYAFLLLFTMTGAVLGVHGVTREIGIDPPQPGYTEVQERAAADSRTSATGSSRRRTGKPPTAGSSAKC